MPPPPRWRNQPAVADIRFHDLLWCAGVVEADLRQQGGLRVEFRSHLGGGGIGGFQDRRNTCRVRLLLPRIHQSWCRRPAAAMFPSASIAARWSFCSAVIAKAGNASWSPALLTLGLFQNELILDGGKRASHGYRFCLEVDIGPLEAQ